MQANVENIPRDQDKIWDYFQNDYPESFAGSRSRMRYLIEKIAAGSTVLNIGCGTGIFEELALDKGVLVHSLDPSERSISSIQKRLGLGDRARVGYIQQIPFADSAFDTVVVSEVFEHLTPEIFARGLYEIKRILRPGGCLIGTVPHREDLRLQIVVCPCCNHKFHRWGHEQTFDVDRIREFLGKTFVTTTAQARPFFAWETLNFKGRIVATLKWLLWRAGCHGASETIVFSALKAH
jgi:SAM-dependent methyltransferase